MALTQVDGGLLSPTNAQYTGFKNRIINGAMMIDQRNAGASVTPASGSFVYTLDRWSFYCSQASKLTAQQSTTAPIGFINSLKVTSSSAYSVLAGDAFILNQPIEGFNTADLGWGTVNAKTVTLSFQVYSSLTGTFGGSILNSAQNRSYPFTYSIPVANTWTTISITIAGDTTGTWLTNNGIGMYVFFGLGVGSNSSGTAGSWAGVGYYSATGATSVVGVSGATFYITGVQLEKGSTATSFDYRPYGTELALCQRYYQKITAADGGVYTNFGSGIVNASTSVWITYYLKTKMRIVPSITTTGTNSDYQVLTAAGGTVANGQPTIDTNNASTDIVFYSISVASGLTAGQACYVRAAANTTAFIGFSSEL